LGQVRGIVFHSDDQQIVVPHIFLYRDTRTERHTFIIARGARRYGLKCALAARKNSVATAITAPWGRPSAFTFEECCSHVNFPAPRRVERAVG